jgi:hypothetical protein
MGRLLIYAGFVFAVEGAGGLVYHFLGWFRLWAVVHRLGFLGGHEVVANLMLIVIGALLMIGGDRLDRGRPRRAGTKPISDHETAGDD